MRRLFLFLLLFGLIGPVRATSVTGSITDAAGQPLPYATAGVVGHPVGTVADDQGRFTLDLPATLAPTDSIRFALLGYRPYSCTVGELRRLPAPLLISLAELPLTLPAATVRAPGLRRQRIGNHNWNANLQTNFAIGDEPDQNVGSEIGRVFQLPRGGAWLDTLRFAIGCTFDSVQLRINVYELGADGQPGRPLLTTPYYLTRRRGQRGWVIADLRAENLFVDAPAVVVAVEWVGHSAEPRDGRLALPITVPAFATHLYRYGAANRWKRFPGMSACLELVVARPLSD